MAKKITLKVVVSEGKEEHIVGHVQVTKDQVEAATSVWDAEEMTEDRKRWVKRAGPKNFFSRGERRYPLKEIMKIASLEQVKSLAEKQENVRFKQRLREGLSKSRGGYQVHGVKDGTIALGYRVEQIIGPEKVDERAPISTTPEASDLNPPPARVRAETYRILRDTKLVRELKVLHKNRCQICGEMIRLGNGKTYSEGHHIQPLGSPHDGPDRAENILILCPNHHVLCDYRAITLRVADLRQVTGHEVGQAFIDYHNSLEAPGS